jgi:hypothetical protein
MGTLRSQQVSECVTRMAGREVPRGSLGSLVPTDLFGYNCAAQHGERELEACLTRVACIRKLAADALSRISSAARAMRRVAVGAACGSG